MTAPQRLNPPVYEQNRRSASAFRHTRSSEPVDRERALPVFPMDILTIDRFLATHVRGSHLAPEKSLLLAVLRDAVSCFQENFRASDRRKKRSFLEANDWIMAEDTSYIFSFVNVCNALNVAPSYLRRGLMRWRDTMSGTGQAGCPAAGLNGTYSL
jgi:hypothetical protein